MKHFKNRCSCWLLQNMYPVPWFPNRIVCSRISFPVTFETIKDNNWYQIIGFPTLGKNTLDLVFVGDESTIENVDVNERFGKSYSNVVHTKVQRPVLAIAFLKTKFYHFNQGACEGLNTEVQSLDYQLQMNSKSIEWTRLALNVYSTSSSTNQLQVSW